MPKKQTVDRRIIALAIFAIVFFALVADRLSFVEFRLSMFEVMLIILGAFLFAVVLMFWKIVLPLSKKMSKKDLAKIF